MMKSFLLTAALLVLAGPLFAQDTILDRLSKLESRLASMEATQKAGQDEIKAALKDIREAIKPQTSVSAPAAGICPVGLCNNATACGLKGCTTTSSTTCDLKGCYPNQQAQYGAASDQGECGSSGGFFSRLRERRAMRRGY